VDHLLRASACRDQAANWAREIEFVGGACSGL